MKIKKTKRVVDTFLKPVEKEEVVQPTPIQMIETEEVEKKTTKKNKLKTQQAYRVLVATPLYFVVDKDGTALQINKKNNYKRGEDVVL